MNFSVEDNVPLPAASQGAASPLLVAIRAMSVGQSIFVPDMEAKKLAGFVNSAKRKTEKQFTTRNTDGGARVWRLE